MQVKNLLLFIFLFVAVYSGRLLLLPTGTYAEGSTDYKIVEFADNVGDDCEFWVDVEGAVLSPGVYCVKQGDLVQTAVRKAGGYNQKAVALRWVQQHINLSCKLKPHQKVYIPFRDDFSNAAPSTPTLKQLSAKDKEIDKVVAELSNVKESCRKLSERFEQTCSKSSGSTISNQENASSNGGSTVNDENNGGQSDATSDCINLNTATLEELDSLDGIGTATAQRIIDARPFSEVEDLKQVSGIGDSKYEKIRDKVCI